MVARNFLTFNSPWAGLSFCHLKAGKLLLPAVRTFFLVAVAAAGVGGIGATGALHVRADTLAVFHRDVAVLAEFVHNLDEAQRGA